MTYRVMQQTEDGMDFCAHGGFASWEAAEDWIDNNQSNWPESRFFVESEENFHHSTDEELLQDVPW